MKALGLYEIIVFDPQRHCFEDVITPDNSGKRGKKLTNNSFKKII